MIPTPVIVDGNRLHAVIAWTRYSIGSGAVVTNFRVYDRETKIADYNGLRLSGGFQIENLAVPNSPAILWGTGISLGVQFSGNGPNDLFLGNWFLQLAALEAFL